MTARLIRERSATTGAGVRVSIDYVLRHHPLHRLAIELTRSESFGALQHFALENFASSASLPPDHWFWDPAVSGGIHVEHGVTAATERTTIRLAFERGHATLEGWIPNRLEVAGTAESERLENFRTLFASAAGGRTMEIAAVVERPDRQDDYRLAIRAGMSNLIGAILRNEPLEVTAEHGLRSLEAALRAS